MSNNNFRKNNKINSELLKYAETNYYIKDLKQGKNAYLRILHRFTEYSGMNPKELIDEAKNNIRGAKDRLLRFGEFLKAKGVSNRTIKQYLASKLGRFFKYNMNPIIWIKTDWNPYPDQLVKLEEIKESGGKNEEWQPLLKKILRRAKNFREKAIICSIFSSAMDLIDLIKITKKIWDENYDKASNTNIIIYERPKTNNFKIAFFNSESCSFLKDYFKYERKIFESENEPIFLTFRKNKKEIEHQRPLDTKRFSHILRTITSELGIEGLTPKSIKNLNTAYLKKASFNNDYIEYQMAYPKGFKNANDPEFIKYLREKYLEIEDIITIGNGSNKTTIKINTLGNKVRELQSEIREIKSELKELNATLLILKTYMTRLT